MTIAGCFVLIERNRGHGTIPTIAYQQLDPLLGAIEHLVPPPGQRNPFLVHPQGVFEAQVPGFELLDDLPQPLQHLIEGLILKLLCWRLAHGKMVWRGFPPGQ
jgi:hypothetical protein